MTDLFYILEEISLPIIIIIVAGFVFQKIFKADVRTFTKFTLYVMTPIVIFVKLYNADISWDFFAQVVPFILLLHMCMYVLGMLLSALFRFKKSLRKAFTNSLVLINTGNYGLPLIDLVFRGNPIAAASQIFIISIQNIASGTVGVYLASREGVTGKRVIINMLKMPAIHILALVFIVKAFNITIPEVITTPLNYLSDGFIAVALVSLGVQLAEVKLGRNIGRVMALSAIKVIAAPLAGFALALLLNIQGVLGAALIIGLSTPTAVTSAMLALEFGNEPEFAAQVVFVTTVMCTFTLPVVIYFVRAYFGLG